MRIVQQSRGKLLKVSFTEASMRTSDSKSTISYLFYTTYVKDLSIEGAVVHGHLLCSM